MQFLNLKATETYFPKKEWLWLRDELLDYTISDDFFLWGTKVGEKTWTWGAHGSGFADLEKKSEDKQIPVLLLDARNELEAFSLYLKTTFQFNAPIKNNDCDWILALKLLESRFEYEIAKDNMPIYWTQSLKNSGLEPHLGVLANRQKFQFLEWNELKFLFDRKWDPSTFEILETWTPELRKAFLSALAKFNVSSQNAKEIASQVFLLTKKSGIETTIKILNSAFGGPDEFRTSLFRTAQPEFAALSQKRVEQLRQLSVPSRTVVFGDPEFEKDLLKITHTPRKFHEFESFREWVSDPETAEKIKILLEIYQ